MPWPRQPLLDQPRAKIDAIDLDIGHHAPVAVAPAGETGLNAAGPGDPAGNRRPRRLPIEAFLPAPGVGADFRRIQVGHSVPLPAVPQGVPVNSDGV